VVDKSTTSPWYLNAWLSNRVVRVQARKIILHELVHGLGFNLLQVNHASVLQHHALHGIFSGLT
jgi:hypothetical protein